jgi:oxysterol-binding protein-related protein 3/6/7
MKSVLWAGKCEADKVSVGTYDVADGEGGMYGLVFDNTFSKTTSKTATFVLMTYPTSAPPTSGHHLHFSQASAAGSSTSLPRFSPAMQPAASTDSLPHEMAGLRAVAADPRPKSMHGTEMKSFGGSTFYTGVMHKRRRNHNNSTSPLARCRTTKTAIPPP